MSRNEHSLGEVVIFYRVSVCLIKRKNVLRASHSKTVRLASAYVERGKSRMDAFGCVGESTELAGFFTYGITCTVTGKNQLSRLAVRGLGVGEAENSLALRPLLAVEDFVRR